MIDFANSPTPRARRTRRHRARGIARKSEVRRIRGAFRLSRLCPRFISFPVIVAGRGSRLTPSNPETNTTVAN